MKKILLATTGLVGAALISGAASAETPKVTLGGFADFQAGYTSENNDGARRDIGFRNDNEITIHVDGKTDAGLGYGAVVDLEADITNDANNQGTNAARTFTYLEGNFGRVELGGNKDAAANLRVDASTLAVASGGINGAWTYFANGGGLNPGNATDANGNVVGNGRFITTSKLFAEHGSLFSPAGESTYNATKITYYTPRYFGFQAGGSYTPDLGDRGQLIARTKQVAGQVGDVWDGALNYENQFSNGLKLSATGAYEYGNADTAANENVSAWNIGGLVGYQGFNIAGSYGDWSDSNQASGSNNDANYWTIGGSYEAGPYGFSVTYLNSQLEVGTGIQDNEFDNIVIGADYKLAPGLTPYAEVSFYDYTAAGTVNDNSGTTLLLGTQVAF